MQLIRKRRGRPVSLCGERQFERVFAGGLRTRSNFFRLTALANEIGEPRLGMIIAKRRIPKAVDRNRFRRLLRESVASNAELLGATDIVVTADSKALGESNTLLREDMNLLWQKLAKRLYPQNKTGIG